MGKRKSQRVCPKCGYVSPKGQLVCPYCWLIFKTGKVWSPTKKKRALVFSMSIVSFMLGSYVFGATSNLSWPSYIMSPFWREHWREAYSLIGVGLFTVLFFGVSWLVWQGSSKLRLFYQKFEGEEE